MIFVPTSNQDIELVLAFTMTITHGCSQKRCVSNPHTIQKWKERLLLTLPVGLATIKSFNQLS